MKIRISGNSIRLRLTQSEVSLFVNEGKVSSSCRIGDQTLTYEINQNETINQITARMSGNTIAIFVPKKIANQWDIDTRVGFESIDDNELYILIEKDFQCLKPRNHEDESDNFPNPQATLNSYD